MLLSWLNLTVSTVFEALWYIGFAPPPSHTSSAQPKAQSKQSERPGAIPRPPQSLPSILQCTATNDSQPPRKSCFFALVIGINEYQHPDVKNLSGCVIDADCIAAFLEDNLGVPSENIKNLRNHQATRSTIKKCLNNLAADSRIGYGDPILIFFAGHGGESKAPESWEAGGPNARIQMLIPYDFVPSTNERENAQGLLDITLETLLSQLARVKGDNITVIFDCCYSGSATRKNRDASTQDGVRGIQLPDSYRVFPLTDTELLSHNNRKNKVASGYERTGRSSHILLAACSKDDTAGDGSAGGHFTQAILQVLRRPNLRIDALTYVDLINSLPDMPKQIPQCEGKNIARALFDGKAPNSGTILYRVIISGNGRTITLEGGEAQGISKNAEFAVYKSTNIASPDVQPLGRMVALTPLACTTPLRPISKDELPFTLPLDSPLWALQTRLGDADADICVHIPPIDDFLGVFLHVLQRMEDRRLGKRNIKLVDGNDSHELAVNVHRNQSEVNVVFDVTDRVCVDNRLVRLPGEVALDGERVYDVLSAAADFFHNLRRSNKRRPLASKVSVEAFKLKKAFLDDDPDTYSERPILVPDSQNLNVNGVMYIKVDDYEEEEYGYKITNTSSCPLYAWVFMFSMSDLSVETLFSPGFAKGRDGSSSAIAAGTEADASIPANGTLTIGYGAGGTEPQSFYLPAGLDVDVTYLKVFLTSQRVDLSHIAQPSPFDENRKPKSPSAVRNEVWDTHLIAIVQKKAGG